MNQPSADDHVQAGIVVGPMLRYVGTESATIWLETTDACEGLQASSAPGFIRPPCSPPQL